MFPFLLIATLLATVLLIRQYPGTATICWWIFLASLIFVLPGLALAHTAKGISTGTHYLLLAQPYSWTGMMCWLFGPVFTLSQRRPRNPGASGSAFSAIGTGFWILTPLRTPQRMHQHRDAIAPALNIT